MIDPTGNQQLAAAALGRSRASLVGRLVRNPAAVAASVYLALLVLTAILAPLLAPMDPNLSVIQDVRAPIGPEHPLGADNSGRDILSRLLFASQFSLLGALTALVVAAVLGLLSGLFAGYYGGWFDTVSSWGAGLLMALPGIVVLLAARAVLGPSMWLSMAIFGVLMSPAFFRLVQTTVRSVRNELFVDAARVSGLGDARIIGRHILGVVRAPVVIQAAMVAGIAIAIQAGLEFLGFGDRTIPTWGSMLNDGFSNIYRDPLQILWPSIMIALTIIALALLANATRDALETSTTPRRRKVVALDVPPEVAATVRHEETGAPTTDVLLRVTDLAVGYDLPDGGVKRVVRGVSFDVHRGEVHGLIGESGSGKTQTAWSILGLLPAGGRIVGGSVVFDGRDMATLTDRERAALRGRKIAYIPQEPMSNLDPAFKIGHQLVEPMRYLLKLSAREARTRALRLLAQVGIPDPERTFRAYPHQISGGMAQRVLIAGAISGDPDLLIADEPTTALDVTVQAEVLDLLRDLQAERQMGVILVTHNLGVVADLCDRVSVMQDGAIVESGPVGPIFAEPRHEYTRALFAALLDEPDIEMDPARPGGGKGLS